MNDQTRSEIAIESRPRPRTRRDGSRSYLNAILTANAALLGVLVFQGNSGTNGLTSTSHAQVAQAGGADGVEDPSGRISAAEQRKQIMLEIRAVGARVERVEQILMKGLNVKVTELPAGFMRDQNKQAEKPEGRPPEIRASRPQTDARPVDDKNPSK